MEFLKKNGRYLFCILLLLAFFLWYVGRLIQWQVVDVDKYQEEAQNNLTDTILLEATRGQILDRNGQILAGNKTTYNVVYNAINMVREERNATIIRVLNLLKEQGEDWEDTLPIVLDENGNYQFAEDSEDEIAALKSQDMLNLADYATADDCMRELADWFNCGGYSKEDTRNVASVRYSMYKSGFSRTNPYIIAKDVSAETVGILSQQSDDLSGIEIQTSTVRYYGEDGALAPHVVGFTGSIQDYQLKQAEQQGNLYDYSDNLSGYKTTDIVGREGLEEAFEEELRGKRGLETLYNDDNGNVKDIAVTVQPEEGHTVYTTLDADLQRAANISLEKNIQANTQAQHCVAGAVVVLDVKNFGVLCSASYPTYDMNRFISDADYQAELNSNNSTKPLFPRATQGVYTPGSIFKPLVALASLQEGVISATSSLECTGLFTLGNDEDTALNLACICGGGTRNVYSALAYSCNVFFCTVGVNLTIKKLDAYAEYFGLGEKTGVELYESSGTMSNPQEYEYNHGRVWMEDATAQTSIGQADNQFTPMQLATYCATIANGGVRLQTHYLQKVTDYFGEETLREFEPVTVKDAGLTADVLGVVREGMIGSATYGTSAKIFGDYPYAVACKTGTAEVSQDDSKEPNLSFICYAPANDPQIAIAVVLEEGYKGVYAQNVAKDVLDQYFGIHTWDADGNRYNQNGDMVDDNDEIIKTKAELDEEQAREEEQKQKEFLDSLGSGTQSTDDSSPTPVSTPSPSDGDDISGNDIPNVPFTGDSSAVSLPPEDDAESTPSPSLGGDDSPYYTGGSSTSSGP